MKYCNVVERYFIAKSGMRRNTRLPIRPKNHGNHLTRANTCMKEEKLCSPFHTLFQADVALIADDEVIDQFYV